jgi:GT2 family glycosyltransferase/glycosyltransferase involved in cell wall biosynthesis
VLIEKDALLGQREVEILQVVAEVSGIRGSLGYRLLEGYRRRIRWLFPPESWRSLPYRALRKAVRLSVDNGRRRAVENQFRRVARVVRKSREIVQREGWRSFASKARRRLISTMKRRPVRASPLSIDYDQWIAANEPDAAELERQREVSLRFPYRPLVSIVVPVWDPPVDTLCEAIESVLSQTYDHWQLCVADGDSKTPVVREHLERFARQDKRVQVKFLEKNLGISGNSNEALAIATGEFVAFLDHTDVLAPNALFEIVQALNRDPRQDCIYSDIDLLSEDGRRRFNPLFKPAWSPDMLLSSNYLAHLCVIRKSCVDELGGLRSETDGAQDWDLLLRLSEMTQRFARVPKVLYHWRADATSAVVSLENKPYAREAQERALREHLERRGLRGAVERDAQSGLRIRWRTTGDIKVSIIIPTKHHRALLGPCLTSIAKSDYKNVEIIVVETAGRSEVREQWYKGFDPGVPFRVLWWDRAFNYSSVNNWAAGQSAGDALLFLNDDTEALAPDWLDEMVGWLEQPGIGVVGARLLAPDGSIQHGGDVLGLEGFAAHMFSGAGQNDWTALGFTNWYRNLLAVTGACLMVRRDTFDTIGGFNEKFVLCGSDVELCLRIHGTGQRVVCTPFAKVLHHERATRGLYDDIQDCFTSFWPYQSHLNRGDPYWSPNLSSHSTIPRLKHPQETTALALVGNVIGRDQTPSAQGAVQIEAEAASLAEACQILPGEVEATRRLHEANSMPLSVKSVNWFVPDFVSPFYGGIHTVFRFADHFKREHGVESRFIVIGTGPEPYVRSGLRTAFPALGDAEIHVCSPNEIDLNALPECDAAIATLWITAYSVSKFQRTKRKFYLVQDFEPGFYPAGTLSALSEATYRLGLYGIANTSTLKAIYESDYGGKAVGFTPCVDTSLFHPPSGPRAEDGALTLFLYGRPGHWRNCYELAIAAIRRLKGRLSKQIRVVTAGSWAASNDAESAYLVDNLGLLDYRATADLYRGCDAGLVLSVSKHPSYLPLELMASGALVVSNVNDAGSWLLRDGVNCLLAEPTAESLCEALERGLTDKALRERLAAQALADIQEGHSDWPSQIEKVFRFMSDPEGSTL